MKVNRFWCVGPGGQNCRCCFPIRGSKARRALYRSAKRRAARLARRDADDNAQQRAA